MLTKLASEIMTSPVVTITPEKPVSGAARLMLDKQVGSIAVVDADGQYIGLLSEFEVHASENPSAVLAPFGSQDSW
jgi:CBS domain-containing protein